MALQAEEGPTSIPTEDPEPTGSKVSLEEDGEDISNETQPTASQPNPTRNYSGRGRPLKTTPLSAQKKITVKKEEASPAKDRHEFQDDPSDADYIPSKYIFISLLVYHIKAGCMMHYCLFDY